jgi:hypothetical protein
MDPTSPKWDLHKILGKSILSSYLLSYFDWFGKSCSLVGGIPTPLKNMKVNWDDDIPNMMGKS